MAETAKTVQEEQKEGLESLLQKARARLAEIKAQLEKLNSDRAAAKVAQDLQKLCIEIASKYNELLEAKKQVKELTPEGPFKGTIKPFEYRALFLKNTSGLVGTLSLIKEAYGIEGDRIELQDEEIEFEDGSTKKFKYFEIPREGETPGRIYTFLLQNNELASRYAGDLFDLNSVKKGSWILYWHQYATQLVSMGKFKNFYPVVWHNSDEQERFIAQKMFFKDQAELMYYMYQVQKYMEERIQTRKQFRDNAIAKKEEHQQRREERNREGGDRGGSDRGDNRRGPRREERGGSDEGDRPRRRDDRGERGEGRREERNDRPRRDDNRGGERPNNRSRDNRGGDRNDNRSREEHPQQNRGGERNAQPPRPSQSWATTAKGKTKQNNKPREYAPAKREGAWAIPQDEHNSEEDAYVPDQHDSGEEAPTQHVGSVPLPVPQPVPMPFYGQAPVFPSPYGYPQQPQQFAAQQVQFNPQQLQQMAALLQMFGQQQPQQTGQ
jgi:hypothetical protein